MQVFCGQQSYSNEDNGEGSAVGDGTRRDAIEVPFQVDISGFLAPEVPHARFGIV